MLNHLSVHNYQRIGEFSRDLGPVTLIVGANGAGKSSVLRALKALCFNKRGDSFIQDGEDSTNVTIFSDPHPGERVSPREDLLVGWEKKRSSSAEYMLQLADDDPQTWTKTGTSVPDEIQEALRIRPIEIEKGFSITPQFQMQHDTPIIAESSSRIARIIGVLTRLDVVVNAQRMARTDKKKAESEQAKAQEDVDRTKVLLDGLEWVPDMRSKVDKLQEIVLRIDELDSMLRQAQKHADRLDEVERILGMKPDVVKARELMNQADVLGRTLDSATPLAEKWDKLGLALAEKPRVIQTRRDLDKAQELIEQANALDTQLDISTTVVDRWDALQAHRIQLAGDLDAARNNHDIAKTAYDDACKECDVCDTCPWR